MPAPADLVFQQTTGTGTGNFTLTTVAGKRTFASAFGTGNTNTFDYFISSKAASEWEIGVGYIDASTGALVRNTVSLSSNSNSAVNFGAGTKDITNDIKAIDQVRGAGTVINNEAVLFDGTSGSLIKSAGFGLGSIASQAANNVSITGGSISGTTISGGTVSSLSSPLAVGSGGTGLSTLTAGDTLYASASNTLAKLAKGTDGQFLKLVSGLPAWGSVSSSVGSVNLRVFSSVVTGATYTPTSGLLAALIILTGGGAGGGGVGSLSTTSKTVSAGGGGSGGIAIAFLNAATIGASQSYTIGAGGSAGIGSNTATAATNGGNGSASLFGSLLTANGGNGGLAPVVTSGTSAAYVGAGGSGGSASSGVGIVAITLTGQAGSYGSGGHASTPSGYTVGFGGLGGGNFWGGGGAAPSAKYGSTTSGINGSVYGGGGSGATVSGATANGANGGTGAAGSLCIFEFIGA